MTVLQQVQGIGVAGNAVAEQRHPPCWATQQHFPQMAQQPKARDVRAGMDAVAVRPQLVQQVVLTAAHHANHAIKS